MTLPGFHECGECGGHRYLGEFEHVDAYTGEHLGNELITCPECGGAGQVPDRETIEVAAEPIHNKRPKCYESWGNEDDGCFCLVKARAALLAYAQQHGGDE